MVGPEHRCLGGLDRIVLVIDRRGGTGEVVDFVDLGPVGLAHVVSDNLKVRTPDQVPHVLFRAGIEVVQTDHVVAFVHQPFAQVGADKARTTSHKDSFHHNIIMSVFNLFCCKDSHYCGNYKTKTDFFDKNLIIS